MSDEMDPETRLRFEYVNRDLGKLEAAVNMLTATVQTLKPARNWPSLVTVIAVVIPLYALVADLIIHGH